MSTIQVAKGILADAEKSLRDLMQQELLAQRYGELGELARFADGLARLAGGDGATVEVPSKATPPAGTSAPAGVSSARVRKRLPSTTTRYPRFERDNERLTKVGWSKKRREEYEHRAPRLALLAFTEHLGRSTRTGATFAIDDVLPVFDSAGDELPSYQVYLAVAWLREMGAVEKRGRDGYVVTHPELDGSAFDVLWEQTPERA